MPQGRGRKLRGSFFCDPLQEAVCENGKPSHCHKPLAGAMGYLTFRQGLLSSTSNISAGLGSDRSLHNYGQVSLSLSPLLLLHHACTSNDLPPTPRTLQDRLKCTPCLIHTSSQTASQAILNK
jgi:hypothetical protein